MKKFFKLSLMTIVAFFATIAVSCSKDDDINGDNNSGLKFNNTSVGKILSAVCEEGHLQGEYWISFSSNFFYDGSVTPFDITVPIKSVSQLKEGQELTNKVDLIVFDYYQKSYEAEGSLKVKKITNSGITLQFKNFSFIISHGSQVGQEYVVNGLITYDLN